MTTARAGEQRTIEYAQERLEEWAAWIRHLQGVRLGHSPHASFMAVHTGGHDAPMDDSANGRAEEVEQVMCKLGTLRPSLHQALIQWYLLQRPQIVCAQTCECAVRVFRDRVRMGEMFVAGRLLG